MTTKMPNETKTPKANPGNTLAAHDQPEKIAHGARLHSARAGGDLRVQQELHQQRRTGDRKHHSCQSRKHRRWLELPGGRTSEAALPTPSPHHDSCRVGSV